MGVMTRKSGENFIITSDRVSGEAPTNSAPKKRATETYLVWTGNGWSDRATEAKIFSDLDGADDYVRSHYTEVMGQMKR
ncbi:MAG TPA: hypothetical protein VHZ24_14015 [Pirellulales bacterium]|jgi:hypothetical protein|nr:hypothetical protein [Pirellulales bacterium]